MIETQLENRVLRLTLNRPEKRNALNIALCKAIVDTIEAAESDPAVNAILLTANGKAFCAGMDLSETLSAERSQLDAIHERLFTLGSRIRKPIIAAVRGPALAGGTGLAANAHILLAHPDATFGLTEIRIALFPILIFRAIKAAVGERRATELALTGRRFGGNEAKEYGLVHELCIDPEIRAAGIAREIATLNPRAVAHGLDYIHQTRDATWAEAGEIGSRIRAEALQNPAFKEAIHDFLK